MKQKLGLACTLVRSPDLLLLDEPTVGVDPLSRKDLWIIINQMVQEEHLSVIVCTAYMNEAAMCDEVYVLNEGNILFNGTPEGLSQVAADKCFEVNPPEGLPYRVLQGALLDDKEEVIDAVPQSGTVRYIAAHPGTALPALERWNLVPRAVPPRVEDGFMILLHQAANMEEKRIPLAPLDKVPSDPTKNDVSIIVKDLVKKFGDFTAVSHTSFEVHKGEVFGLLGPNGAGKTTTFRMLCGLLPATSGVLSVAGENLRTARTQARAKIGYVSQKFSLYSKLSVLENLQFYGGIYGLPPRKLKERIQEVMGSRRSWRSSSWWGRKNTMPETCREGTNSGCPWPVPCSRNRKSCSWTNPPAASIPWHGGCSGGRSPTWPAGGSPSSLPPISWKKRNTVTGS